MSDPVTAGFQLSPQQKHLWSVSAGQPGAAQVAVLLEGKGYETLLPTFAAKKKWAGKQKESNVPLFPGYVFCQFNVHDRLPVLVTPGVISVVGRGKVPVAIEESEISAIQQVICAGVTMEPFVTPLTSEASERN